MNAERLDEIKARVAAATPGPWEWFGNVAHHDVYLSTKDRGRLYIMCFERWGMRNAKPIFRRDENGLGDRVEEIACFEVDYRQDFVGLQNPEAELIAHAPTDLQDLITALEAALFENADLREQLDMADARLAELDGRYTR